MIGNDVVDLADPESDPAARHPRFDARVFAPSELALVRASADAERVRWTLWAAKESAYKVARRTDPRTVFAPVRFVVTSDDGASPTRLVVTYGSRRFLVRVSGGHEHVHALACPLDICGAVVCCGVRGVQTGGGAMRITAGADGAGAAARALARSAVASVLGVMPADVVVGREHRIPTLWVRGRRSRLTLSLSHHGRFVAFACATPATAA